MHNYGFLRRDERMSELRVIQIVVVAWVNPITYRDNSGRTAERNVYICNISCWGRCCCYRLRCWVSGEGKEKKDKYKAAAR